MCFFILFFKTEPSPKETFFKSNIIKVVRPEIKIEKRTSGTRLNLKRQNKKDISSHERAVLYVPDSEKIKRLDRTSNFAQEILEEKNSLVRRAKNLDDVNLLAPELSEMFGEEKDFYMKNYTKEINEAR
jgi:hypothetical protein